ncbi:DNA-binding GntR family transcriptional regulator [Catenulispora sp. MAP5-51]|uniref:GntR family transcriptional regulator n=1 Tax=Catenulispora sp. MAP5-51 TaxID=3156298 RepID=UPI0035198B5F
MPEALFSPAGSSPGALPSRTEAVLEAIKHAILTGELKPGRPLVETDLAAELGVSKTPVREALKTLAGTGLVTMSPYKGATVREIDRAHARAIYDMRLLLEPTAAGRSVSGPRDWSPARAALEAADQAEDAAGRSLANRAFHRHMYLGCGNPLLVRTLDDLRDQTALVSAAAWAQRPSWEREAAEHRAILDAAERGDTEEVRDLMRSHISSFVARTFPEDA